MEMSCSQVTEKQGISVSGYLMVVSLLEAEAMGLLVVPMFTKMLDHIQRRTANSH